MSKNSSPSSQTQTEWIDVSIADDAPSNFNADSKNSNSVASGNDAERSTEPSWALYIGWILCFLVVIWATSWITRRRVIAERAPLHIETTSTLAPPPETPKMLLAITQTPTPATANIVVHLTGAVKKPGVYELSPRSRLRDAVHLAAGPLSDADLEAVNLAEFLTDGQQYAIPHRNANVQTAAPTIVDSSARTSRSARVERSETVPKVTVKAAPRAPRNAPPTAPLDLNSATAIELDTLPDIGPTKAARIVEYRTQNGAFKSVEDLTEVEGIGEKTLEKLRAFVFVR